MTNEIHNDNPLIHYPHLCRCLAFHSAVKRIKKQIAARGEKLHEHSRKDLHILADQYLEANRHELFAEVIERVQTDPEFRKLAQAELKRRGRYWAKPSDRAGPEKIIRPIAQMHLALAELMKR
jgi:hypothetical protein